VGEGPLNADEPTRRAAAERLAWIQATARGPRLLVLRDEEPEPPDPFPPGQRFDTVVIGPLAADKPAAAAIVADRIALALAVLDGGGRLILTVPFGEVFTPRALIELLRGRLAPRALFARADHLHFWGTNEPSPPEADEWEAFASPEALLQLTETAALEARAFDARRRECQDHALRGLVERAAARARSTVEALGAALDHARRLRQTVERARRSARYQLGSAMIAAARPSMDTLRLPGRLFQIYRAKATGRSAPRLLTHRADARRAELLDERLTAFLSRAQGRAPARLVVVFSGARVTGTRADRPSALTRALHRRGVPVIFGYHGGLGDGEPPSSADPQLLELPADFLTTRLHAIAAAPFPAETRKLFLVAYPTPAVAPFVNRFNTHGWVTAYDALDDWEEFARAGVADWYVGHVERFLVNNTDFSAGVSRPLQAKLRAFTDSRDVLLSPNAYDPAFGAPGYRRRPAPAVTVGYVGHLTPAWFDWPSLGTVARSRPDYRFQIIGHGAPRDLDLPPNVELLGPKDHAAIRRCAESWSAAIIPFKVGKLADAVDPIKVYEYLALQLPVVSFRMPQISSYPYTRTVETTDQFVAALDLAVTTPVDGAVVKEFLAANTWDHRLDAILDRADRVLAEAPFEKRLHGAPPLPVVDRARRPIVLGVGGPDDRESWGGFVEVAARLSLVRSDIDFWLVGGDVPSSEESTLGLLGAVEASGLSSRFRWFPRVDPGAMPGVYAYVRASGGAVVASRVGATPADLSALHELVARRG
jgi:glycosyltransferase involved in cell wall biosynthesis